MTELNKYSMFTREALENECDTLEKENRQLLQRLHLSKRRNRENSVRLKNEVDKLKGRLSTMARIEFEQFLKYNTVKINRIVDGNTKRDSVGNPTISIDEEEEDK